MSVEIETTGIDRREAQESLQESLAEVTTLLRRHRLIEGLVYEQMEHGPGADRSDLVESLVFKQDKAVLQHKLDTLHPADIAYILEALPLDERLYI